MLIDTATDVDLFKFCTILHIPKSSSWQLVSCYRKWLRSMGPESTITRLKSLKVGLLSGEIPQSAIWIATKRDGRPKGAFGYLWSKHVTLERALNVITAFISNTVSTSLTEKQWDKFILSASKPDVPLDVHLRFRDLPYALTRYESIFCQEADEASYDPYIKWVNSPTQKALMPVADANGRYVSVVENTVLPGDHISWLEILDFPYRDKIYKRVLKHYIEACGVPDTIPCGFTTAKDRLLSGSVAVIQERGMKARVIANPLRVHQMVLSKLGNMLFAVARRMPWDCTFDQGKGIEFVQSALLAEKTVFCHDLSDATNNFPLDFSILLLESIAKILPLRHKEWFLEHTQILEMVSRGKWQPPIEVRGRLSKHLTEDGFITWTVGVPLGLYPSFPLFALSHGILIRVLEYRLGKFNTFRILGDDVVIVDQQVSDAYLQALELLNVPVSKEKSLISKDIGEFAGKVISRNGLLNVEKWKDPKRSFLDIVRWLGMPGVELAPSRYRKVLREIAMIPQPLGLGFNPNGWTFNQRIPEYFEELYIRSTEETSALPSPLEDIKAEMALEVETAFKGNHIHFGVDYGLALARQERVDPVAVDHLNSIYDHFGYVPDQHLSAWKAVRDLTFRRTRYKTALNIGRFGYLYRYRKRYLRSVEQGKNEVNSR